MLNTVISQASQLYLLLGCLNSSHKINTLSHVFCRIQKYIHVPSGSCIPLGFTLWYTDFRWIYFHIQQKSIGELVVLHMQFYICNTCAGYTDVLQMYFYTCNTYMCASCVLQVFYTCITGVWNTTKTSYIYYISPIMLQMLTPAYNNTWQIWFYMVSSFSTAD